MEGVWCDEYLPVPVVLCVARLCPWLRDISCDTFDGEELADALESLERVAGTLKELDLSVDVEEEIEPGNALRAAEALGHLSSLRLLRVAWDCPSSRACLLAPTLSSLSLLSSLEVTGPPRQGAPPPQEALGLWPGSLRDVTLQCAGMLGRVHALLHLGGVTTLRFIG